MKKLLKAVGNLIRRKTSQDLFIIGGTNDRI